MGVPSPSFFYNGVGAVGGDSFNTYMQVVFNVAQLRTLQGISNAVIVLLGSTAPNDGGQSLYYFSGTGTYVDNGSTVIVPNSSFQGAWLRLPVVATTALPSGSSLPTTNPGVGSEALWNNGGFVCVA